MSLAHLFDGIVGSDWDAENGSVNDFVPLADGTYDGVVTKIEWKETKKGGDGIHISIESQDDEGSTVYPRASIYFSAEITDKNKSFNEQGIKTLMKLALLADVELTEENFDEMSTLPEALEDLKGQDLTIEVTTDGEFSNGKIDFDA